MCELRLTEVCRKSRNAVQGSSAEKVATQVQNGSGTEFGPAATCAFHAVLDEMFGGGFDGARADREVLFTE